MWPAGGGVLGYEMHTVFEGFCSQFEHPVSWMNTLFDSVCVFCVQTYTSEASAHSQNQINPFRPDWKQFDELSVSEIQTASLLVRLSLPTHHCHPFVRFQRNTWCCFLCMRVQLMCGGGGDSGVISKRLTCNFVWPRFTVSSSLMGDLQACAAVSHGSSHTCTHMCAHTRNHTSEQPATHTYDAWTMHTMPQTDTLTYWLSGGWSSQSKC